MNVIQQLIFDKERKENKRITQKEVAFSCGMNSSTLYLIMTGETSCKRSEHRLKAIADYFGLTVDELKKIVEKKFT